MLVPLSWLKDYVDIDVTPDVLEEKLFSCGFEVEEKYEVGKDISNVAHTFISALLMPAKTVSFRSAAAQITLKQAASILWR